MLIAFTGHRPAKLGGYDNNTNKRAWFMTTMLKQPWAGASIITGMALGVDTWAAEFAINNGISFHAYVPFKGQETMWPASSQIHYNKLLKTASSIVYVCNPGYAAWKMQKRNEAMVDACDVLYAIWDGSTGGTGNCVRYARKVGKTIVVFNPFTS
jgi:uncharacterized phage-like protein YoqJ